MPQECRKAFEINHLEFARHCASRTATGLNSFQHRLNVSTWAVIPANLDGRPMRTTRPRHWRLLSQPHHCLYMRGADRWRGHLICAYLCQKLSCLCSFPRWWYCSCCFGMKFHLQLTSSASLSLLQANPKCCRIRSTFQASLRQEGDARSPVVSRLVSPWKSNTDPGWTISEPKNSISWLAALTSS